MLPVPRTAASSATNPPKLQPNTSTPCSAPSAATIASSTWSTSSVSVRIE